MKSKLLNVTFGISGCGKSTYLSKIGSKSIVETDDLRRTFLGDVNDISKEKYIFDLAKGHILELLESYDRVYLGATNVNSKYRAPYLIDIKEQAKKMGYELEICLIVFNCDIEVSRQRILNDLSNKVDRANSIALLEEQYKQFKEAKTLIKQEKLYKFIHYV